MLLPLPIAIMTMFSPVAAVDAVPTFDIVRECRIEGGSSANVNQCSYDEAAALEELRFKWLQFIGVDKSNCLSSATIGGFASYVDLLTCLEMARDRRELEK